MNKSANGRLILPVACAAWLGLLSVQLTPASGQSEDLQSYTGYTRPGAPNDTRSDDGKIIFVANDPDGRKEALGGTVYYMVLKLQANAEDPWNTGLKDFSKAFRPGIDFSGAGSPELDSGAKYLYLYQVVNDRRTLSPIENASVKLLVDLKDVTSWGHFSGVGFATQVEKEGKEAAKKKITVRPVSFSNIVAASAEAKVYRSPAPAVPISQLFRLTRIPTKRGEDEPAQAKGGIVQVVWDALDPANNPDYVMLLSGSDFEGNSAAMRSIWNGKNSISKDGRSTVFGFTSNYPPTLEMVRIHGPRGDKEGGKIRPAGGEEEEEVSFQAGDAPAPGTGRGANGRVPTPQPPSSSSNAPPPFSPMVPPGTTPNAGGAPFMPSGGGMGMARPGAAGGGGGVGGFAGGSGNGSGNAQAAQNQSQQPNQNGQQIINFSATLINQQAQAQSQRQKQSQNQSQSQHQHHSGGGGGGVVPEPGSLILAGLGMPFLLLALWRRQRHRQPELI